MPQPATIPVTVLTGFLGSGKNTVLNRLADESGTFGHGLIINEFGEIGPRTISSSPFEESLILLNNGCLWLHGPRRPRSDARRPRREDYGRDVPPFSARRDRDDRLADPRRFCTRSWWIPLCAAMAPGGRDCDGRCRQRRAHAAGA